MGTGIIQCPGIDFWSDSAAGPLPRIKILFRKTLAKVSQIEIFLLRFLKIICLNSE